MFLQPALQMTNRWTLSQMRGRPLLLSLIQRIRPTQEMTNVLLFVVLGPKPKNRILGSGMKVPKKVFDEDLKALKADTQTWIQCSGLHTVEEWVKNYRKHPAGWAALFMIHGIPEVTNRLRVKVQNYATFAALFLAGSIKAATGPLPVCTNNDDTWECHLRKRTYTYSLFLGMAAHILCIFLAMAFHNSLNEAARDSDVFRMFARGKGYRATVKCQHAFRIGILGCCLAMVAVAQEHVGWDALVWAVFLACVGGWVLSTTATPLFMNASIVRYWREELGGKPDADDPYDLSVPVELFSRRVQANECGLLHKEFAIHEQSSESRSDIFGLGMPDHLIASI